jgi:hypothetical protein
MAKAVYDNVKVASRIKELRNQIAKRNSVTIDDLMAELEEARKIAKDAQNPSAMVTATMGKAKILGLDKPSPEGQEDEAPNLDIVFNVSGAKGEVRVTRGK